MSVAFATANTATQSARSTERSVRVPESVSDKVASITEVPGINREFIVVTKTGVPTRVYSWIDERRDYERKISGDAAFKAMFGRITRRNGDLASAADKIASYILNGVEFADGE